MKLFVVLQCLAVSVEVSDNPTFSERIILTDSLAKCLDGSPAAYYISRGSNKKAFYLYHVGGGWCQTEDECKQRAQTPFGSSLSYPPTWNISENFLMRRDDTQNPLMSNWTFVSISYCDGGSFTGDAAVGSLHFRGKRIREAVVRSLSERFGFDSATDIVIGGCSAGGAAAFFHTDWYASQVPTAKVRGMPDSGWFVDGDYNRDGKDHYEARMKNMFTMMNSAASLSPACVAQLGHKCLFAPNYIPYVKTPVFAVNSKYDASMADGTYDNGNLVYNCTEYTRISCDTASVNTFGMYITSSMEKLLLPPHGAFLDSCYHHCTAGAPPYMIGGIHAGQAMASWYNKGSESQPNHGFWDRAAPFPCDSCCTEAEAHGQTTVFGDGTEFNI